MSSEKVVFQDLFSGHAACYARSRPGYPAELFAYLAELCGERRLAWDCATGSGQAAVGLTEHFDRVIATDASEAQLAHATPHDRIEYRAMAADGDGIEDGSVDLVTVAQALHWLPLEAFYSNVRRVLRPGGVIAAWCYALSRVSERIDALCDRFYHDVVGSYWEAGRRYIDEQYETIAFPFEEIRPTPRFACRAEWTLAEYLDYLASWSAVQLYRKDRGTDPVEEMTNDLKAAWNDSADSHGEGERRRVVTWPVHLRLGYCSPP